ncbi:transposase [Gemmata massiliana]|uniref:transposase n=1 Tax=Gemmata massiliana TaxID=1210884 RepID=UPI0013A6DB8E
MSTCERHPSDLTDPAGQHRAPIPAGRWPDHLPHVPLREVVNAALDLVWGGRTWRMLPHDVPPRETVSYGFYTWHEAGVWEPVHNALRSEIRARDEGTDPARGNHRPPVGEDHRGGPEGVRAHAQPPALAVGQEAVQVPPGPARGLGRGEVRGK